MKQCGVSGWEMLMAEQVEATSSDGNGYILKKAEGLMKERRGKSSKAGKLGRPPKLTPAVEEDLIAENQQLRMEKEYLKKLHALVLSKIESEKGTKLE